MAPRARFPSRLSEEQRVALIVASFGALVIGGFVAAFWKEGDAAPEDAAPALLMAGDHARAVRTSRAAYRADPAPQKRVELAYALIGAGQLEDALALLQGEGFDDAPGVAVAARRLEGEALVRAGRFADALSLGEAMFAEQPADSWAGLLVARAQYGLGARAAAAAALAEALRTGSEARADAWLFRARMALDADEMQTARSALARAGEAGAAAAAIEALAIEARLRDGAFDDARRMLAARRNAKPANASSADPAAARLMAQVEAASGDYVAAARRLGGLSHILDAEPNGALFAALVMQGAGDTGQAEARFISALRVSPAHPWLLDAYAALLVTQGRFEQAETIVSRLTAADETAGRISEAALHLARSDHTGALEAAKGVRAPGARLAPAAIAFGGASEFAKRDAVETALASALVEGAALRGGAGARALEAADRLAVHGEPAALALAGELYLVAGDDERAREAFSRALGYAPAFETALAGLLRIDIRAGDPAQAIPALEAALTARPDALAPRLMLARVLDHEGRPGEALGLLAPVSAALTDNPQAALYFAALLKREGEDAALVRFAGEMRRARPAHRATAEILAGAGRLAEAAGAARAALLDSPHDPAGARLYADVMARRGRQAESAAFLAELARRRPLTAQDPAETGETELLLAWLDAPQDAEAALRFGAELAQEGDQNGAAHVMREACFWGGAAACGVGEDGDSPNY